MKKTVKKSNKISPAQQAKIMKEMADSILVRNHIQVLLESGRYEKENRDGLYAFIKHVDSEIARRSISILPEKEAVIPDSKKEAFAEIREMQTAQRAKMEIQKKTAQQGKKSGMTVSRVSS